MTSNALGVAIIGGAFMGKAHSNAWRNVSAFHPEAPAVRQAVLVAHHPVEAERAAKQYGWAEAATDWREVIARDDVDIVDICLPGHLHCEVAIAALEAGKHVLVEKPLANTIEEAEKMVQAADAAAERGLRSMVGFNYRRVPALALARDLIAAGEIGEVREVRASYLQDWLADPAAPMTWRLRKETAGSGAIGDLGSHAIDQVRFLTGQQIVSARGRLHTFVTERRGEAGPEPVTVDDTAWATLALSDGAVASVEVSRVATGRKNSLSLEIYGGAGAISFSLESLNELWVARGGSGFSRILVTEPEHPYVGAYWPPGHILGWNDTFTNEMADLLRAIASGTAPSPSFADGLAVQRVLAAIEESDAVGGRDVDLDLEEA